MSLLFVMTFATFQFPSPKISISYKLSTKSCILNTLRTKGEYYKDLRSRLAEMNRSGKKYKKKKMDR